MKTSDQNKTNELFRAILLAAILALKLPLLAQYPPSHDPSTMIQNTDGRYWIFTTGQGIWAMSSSNADFTNWQTEPTPFPTNSWPGWISNYVDGFTGFFWAPDIIKIGSTYYLYYSCAGNGAPAAIGLATATNLAGPWTDQGMVVAGNNAIDPAVILDNGRLWMTWGNWQSGIDIVELSTSSGKPVSGYTHLVSGEVEGPALMKNGNYYYLFYQRGLCCNGVNSTYYVVVARSTSITGPYTSERVFLPNQSGNVIGPGHVGYRYGRLTYHFYDANDNGNARLMVRTDFGFANGWPYVGSPPSSGGPVSSGGTYRITPGHSGKAIDVENCGTGSGTNVRQWSWLNNNCQKWIFTDVGGGSWRITPSNATGQALDLTNCDGANLANIRLWSWLNNDCQKWELLDRGGGYYSIRSRASGKCLDISGNSSADGANLIQYTCNSGSYNQQFSFQSVSSSRVSVPEGSVTQEELQVFPNPAVDHIRIKLSTKVEGITKLQLINSAGRVIRETAFDGVDHLLDIGDISPGLYMLRLENEAGILDRKVRIK